MLVIELIKMINRAESSTAINKYLDEHPHELNDNSTRCGWTALGAACTQNHVDQVETLLKRPGVNPNLGDETASSVLLVCASRRLKKSDKVRLVTLLAEAGADLNSSFIQSPRNCSRIIRYEMTPLDVAAILGKRTLFNCLKTFGANLDRVYNREGVMFFNYGDPRLLLVSGFLNDHNYGKRIDVWPPIAKKISKCLGMVFFARINRFAFQRHETRLSSTEPMGAVDQAIQTIDRLIEEVDAITLNSQGFFSADKKNTHRLGRVKESVTEEIDHLIQYVRP